MNLDLSKFYQHDKRLKYHPSSSFLEKRRGFKKFIAFDDRFPKVKKELEELILKNEGEIKVLDLGVGDGIYESMLGEDLRRKCLFYGVDISLKQMNRAKKYLKETVVLDLNSQVLPFSKNFFNIVIASEILEHVFFPERVVEEAKRVLKKEGYLLVTFPNSGSLQLRLSLLTLGSSPLLNYPQNQEHIRFLNSLDVEKMMGKSFKLIKRSGLGSFVFDRWNFPLKVPFPRVLQLLGNKFLPNLALGTMLVFKKI